ncbi:hypothetical protein CRUP_001943 [Coryphaenoides rupestris]|nr:hypothetical protein CRUP_001943 [Coryphaenoides rupestris]
MSYSPNTHTHTDAQHRRRRLTDGQDGPWDQDQVCHHNVNLFCEEGGQRSYSVDSQAAGCSHSPLQCHSSHACKDNPEEGLGKTTIRAENEVEANKLVNNYRFGFRKWKSHVTERPFEDRSEVVKELYSELNIIKPHSGHLITVGNIAYVFLFGWWVSLVYLLVCILMFITVIGTPYGREDVVPILLPSPTEVPDSGMPIPPRTPYWVSAFICTPSFNVLFHSLACVLSWTLVFTIPVAKMNWRTLGTILLMAPEDVSVATCSQRNVRKYFSISAQSNFAVGALVNATFGSITEMTFYITALIRGHQAGNACLQEIVKAALTGTLFGCILFIPGISMVIGGLKHSEQRFNSRSTGVGSALLFISVGGVFAPTLFSKAYGSLVCDACTYSDGGNTTFICRSCHYDLNNYTLFHNHIEPLVYSVSVLLPVAYIIGLFFTLKTHSHIYDIHVGEGHGTALVVVYLILLALYFFASVSEP